MGPKCISSLQSVGSTQAESLIAEKAEEIMATITTKDGTPIYYKDWGKGQPVVFSHGWPLSGDQWDGQMLFFGQRGYRVIAHDRRGHGRSDQTCDGNEMDTYADERGRLQVVGGELAERVGGGFLEAG